MATTDKITVVGSKPIYLDHAAATPVDPAVLASMQPFFSDAFHNPSALYRRARRSREAIDSARITIASCLGARSSEIIFTSGATEANNLAIHGILQQYPNAEVLMSAVEHESVLAAADMYACKKIPVDSSGRIDVAKAKNLITDATILVSVMYANNEVGTIQPLKELSAHLAQVREQRVRNGNQLPIYLHTDAAQAANYLDLHVHKLGVDLMTINSGKIYGPKGAGALWMRAGVSLQAQLLGGGQELGRRSGTENVAAIVGFAHALQLVQASRRNESDRLTKLCDDFFDQLTGVTNVEINGSLQHRLPNNIHLTFLGKDNERMVMELDEQGLEVATGSACNASNDTPSHVLLAMGRSSEQARSSIRITLGRGTDEQAMRALVNALQVYIEK